VTLVVDASVVAKWVFPEEKSLAARGVLDHYTDGTESLIAPDFLMVEVANIAWKKCLLRGEITSEEALQGIRFVSANAPQLFDSHTLLEHAFSIAIPHKRTVYDCLYVALAMEQRCDLLTADSRLVNALGPAFGFVRLLT
jgi:predicted nucleic acid-binding protein